MTPFVFPVTARLAGDPVDPVAQLFSVLSRGDIISFAGGIPDGELFELDDIKASFDHVLTHHARRALQYGSTPGEPELREVAARQLTAQGVPTTPEMIQVTTGSQEGIYLAGRSLLSHGDTVLVEEPTYLAAVQAFRLHGARLVGVPTDAGGVIPDALERAIAEHSPSFLYLVPSFQNPTGRTMPLQRRLDVAEILVREGLALVEDDPYGDLRFAGDRLPAMASLPGMARQTLLLNSMSKVMAPGLRVGWLRGEGPVMRTISMAKSAVTLQSAALNQLAVAYYLTHYDLDEHGRRVCASYQLRRDAMYDGLRAMLPAAAQVTRPDGGMFCWVTLGDDTDTAELLAPAIEEGVAFVPGWSFYAGAPDRSTMRLSYVTNSPATIAEGLGRLAAALDR